VIAEWRRERNPAREHAGDDLNKPRVIERQRGVQPGD